MTLSLGLDIGTSGIRTAVLDQDGTRISTAQVEHLPQDQARIDARKWWDAAQTCIAHQVNALEDLGYHSNDIARVAIDGTSGTMVLTDATLEPVTRALMYNSKGFDAEAEVISQFAPDVHITRGTNSALARALRLVSEDASGKAAHLLHQADFIAAKLLGHGGISDHNNALKTGFDPETGTWPDWVEAVFPTRLLPDPHPVGTELGQISKEVAALLGLHPATIICAGTTDSIAAFLAAAPLRPGVAVTSLGSTLAVKALSAARIDDPTIGLYSHRLGDVWLAGGASNTGGAVLLDFFTPEEMARLSAQINPEHPTTLDYYPLRTPGERFPFNDPTYPPRLSPRPDADSAFLQGIFEGIARIEAQCYQSLVARGGRFPDTIYTAGGGAQNPTFTRIRAKVLGITPSQAAHSDAAIGAARIAAGHV